MKVKQSEVEGCLKDLLEVIDLCAKKKFKPSDIHRVYVKVGDTYETMKTWLPKKKQEKN